MAIGSLLGGVGGLIGGIVGAARGSKGGGRRLEKKAREILLKLEDPKFDPREIPHEDLRIVAEFYPEVYEAVVPDDVKLAVDSPEGRGAEVRSLAKLERVRDEGLPLAERIAAQEAQEAIAGEHQRGQEYVIRDLAQKGRLGGGEELAARIGAGQSATDLEAKMARDLEREAIGQRMAATYGAADVGSRLRGEDIDFSQTAANAINRFNEMETGRRMEAAREAAQWRNIGGAQRAGERQRIAEANAAGRGEAARYNLERKDRNELAAKGFALERAGLQSRGLLDLADRRQAREDERRRRIQAIGQGAGKTVGGVVDLAGTGGFGGFGG